MNLFKDLQEEFGISYLLVAHDLATTRDLAHQVAVMYLGRIAEIGPSDQVFDNPQHPCTEALFSAALPGHPDDVHEEILLEGELPSPLDPPRGCPFHPRCPRRIGTICETQSPVLTTAEGRPKVACHLY